MDIQPSTPDAIAFLRSWAPQGPWVLTAIDPERGGNEKQRIQTRTFLAEQEKEAAVWINSWQSKRNIYFTVNHVREAVSSKPEKKDIGWLTTLHVDIDPAEPPKDCADIPKHYEDEQERILLLLNTYSPLPTVITYSGGGYQGFWMLKEAVEIAEPSKENPKPWDQLELYNKKIEKDLGGDHCFNVDRVMRLPGTINVPNAKKRAKGRTPALAGVVSADWEQLYDLDAMVPLAEARAKPREESKPVASIPKREPLEWCSRLIAEGNDPEGPRSYNGDRSKAVYAVCCSLVRSGWSDEDIAAAILDPKNKISGHVLHQGDPPKYALRQAAKARKKVGEEFQINDKGRPIPSQFNLRLAFARLEIELSHNLFSNQDLIEGPHGEATRYLDDNEERRIYLMIDEVYGFRPTKEFFHDVVANECRFNRFHPVHDYLDALKWDGVERLDAWLATYAGALDTPYLRAVGPIMLIAACRRVRQPGVKFDEMMVFDSGQGRNKSSALAIMAVKADWFTDSLPLNAEGKVVIENLAGKWIVEAGELKGMHASTVEHLKGFLSRQIDRGRLAYGRRQTEVPRQCVFFGTTNAAAFLRDDANRRFWPVHIELFDLESLRADRDQLWAEASTREAAGESIRLDKELWPFAAEEQALRTIDDPWVNIIEHELGNLTTGKILIVDMWTLLDMRHASPNQQYNARLGEAMRVLGWERKQLRLGEKNRYYYCKGTVEERKTRIGIVRNSQTNALEIYAWGDRGDPRGQAEQDIPL